MKRNAADDVLPSVIISLALARVTTERASSRYRDHRRSSPSSSSGRNRIPFPGVVNVYTDFTGLGGGAPSSLTH
jgi:hypothetical protein